MKLWKRFMKTNLELNSVMRHFWNSAVWLGPGGKGWEKVEYWILFASRHIRPTAQISAVKFHCTLGILVVGNACDFPEFSQQALSASCLKDCKKPIGKGTVKDKKRKRNSNEVLIELKLFFFPVCCESSYDDSCSLLKGGGMLYAALGWLRVFHTYRRNKTK